MATSRKTNMIFIASMRSVCGYIVEKGRNFELARVVESLEEYGNANEDYSQCALSEIFSEPSIVLGTRYLGDEINCIICDLVTINGELRELVIAATDDGKIYVWFVDERLDLMKSREPLILDNEISSWSLAVHPSRDILAVGANDHNIGIFSLSSGNLLGRLEGHEHNIPSISFSPCGDFLISASIDGSCKLWDIQNISCITECKLGDGQWGWGAILLETPKIERLASRKYFCEQRLRNPRNYVNAQVQQYSEICAYETSDIEVNVAGSDFEEYDEAYDTSDLEIGDHDRVISDLFQLTDRAIELQMDGSVWRLSDDEQRPSGRASTFFFSEDVIGAEGNVEQAIHPLEIQDPPRLNIRGDNRLENATPVFFHRLQPYESVVRIDSPQPSSFELRFPDEEMLAISFTEKDMIFFDPATGHSLLKISSLLKKAFGYSSPHWNVANRERFCMNHWIEEFSCLIVANQCGSMVLVHLCKKFAGPDWDDDSEDILRVSIMGFPAMEQISDSLKGFSVRKIDNQRGPVYYEIFALHTHGVLRVYRLRHTQLGPQIDLLNV